MRIDLVGPFPPPYGGISVHLQRLVERLVAAGHDAHMIPSQASSEKLWTAYRRIWRESAGGDLLHFHGAGWMHFFCLGILAVLGRKLVLTIHSQSFQDMLDKSAMPARWAARFGVRQASAVIAVNERIQASVQGAGIRPERVHVIPAFLPPDGAALFAQALDEDAAAFVAAHEPVISANAFNLDDYQGVPLYGSDLFPGLLVRLRRTHSRAGVLLYLSTYGAGGAERLDVLRAAARESGVEEHFCVVTGSRPFGPALVRSQVMVRPTVTDGDAVSVREALWLGIPVVATDCVERPEGTIVVRTRDANAMAAAVEAALDSTEARSGDGRTRSMRDPFDDMLLVYSAVLEGHGR